MSVNLCFPESRGVGIKCQLLEGRFKRWTRCCESSERIRQQVSAVLLTTNNWNLGGPIDSRPGGITERA